MANLKPTKQGSSNTPRLRAKHISNARHHGRTFCTRCGTKIAFGMQFCNGKCRQAFIDGERGPQPHRNTPARKMLSTSDSMLDACNYREADYDRRLADAIDVTINNLAVRDLSAPDAAAHYADSDFGYPIASRQHPTS